MDRGLHLCEVKGFLHVYLFYCFNLIFWIAMRLGINVQNILTSSRDTFKLEDPIRYAMGMGASLHFDQRLNGAIPKTANTSWTLLSHSSSLK